MEEGRAYALTKGPERNGAESLEDRRGFALQKRVSGGGQTRDVMARESSGFVTSPVFAPTRTTEEESKSRSARTTELLQSSDPRRVLRASPCTAHRCRPAKYNPRLPCCQQLFVLSLARVRPCNLTSSLVGDGHPLPQAHPPLPRSSLGFRCQISISLFKAMSSH